MAKSKIQRSSAHEVLSASHQEKFWARVLRADAPDACWSWLGKTDKDGYGYLYVPYPEGARHSEGAHRVAWQLTHKRAIPVDRELDHICRNTRCVKPAHLDLVTSRENTLRGEGPSAQEARQTHCRRGHELSGDNLMVVSKRSGREYRECRTCSRAKLASLRQRRKDDGCCIDCGKKIERLIRCAECLQRRKDRKV